MLNDTRKKKDATPGKIRTCDLSMTFHSDADNSRQSPRWEQFLMALLPEQIGRCRAATKLSSRSSIVDEIK